MGLFSKRAATLPQYDPTALCNLLIDLKWVTPNQINEALNRRAEDEDKKVGEILITLGYLTNEQLETALHTQRVKRGKMSDKEATLASLELQSKLHEKVMSGLTEFNNMAVSAMGGTHKFASIKRSK